MIQNRLFFFAAYQGKVEKTEPSTAQRFVPSAAMRAGDFTAFASPARNNGRQVALRRAFCRKPGRSSGVQPRCVEAAELCTRDR